MKNFLTLRECNILFLIIVSFVLLGNMLYINPGLNYGDSREYVLQTMSIANHLTPDLRNEDLISRGYNKTVDDFIPGYPVGKNGRKYAVHFWAYSAVAAPILKFMDFTKFDWQKSFQITNVLLLILFFIIIVFFSNFSEAQKLLFNLLSLFSPLLWYLHWPHPEVFMFIFVSLSFVFMRMKKFVPAVLCASLASFHNQLLLVVVTFLLVKGLFEVKSNSSRLGLIIISGFAALPNLFYYAAFRQYSLLTRVLQWHTVTLHKVLEWVVDLNIGILPYVPLTPLLFLGIVVWKTWKTKKVCIELQLLCVLALLMTVGAAQSNWNQGSTGMARYCIWMLPFIFFVVTENLDNLLRSRTATVVLIFSLATQIYIAASAGFVPGWNYLEFRPAAAYVLDNTPSLYNPTFEIFCERTLHREGQCEDPTIYSAGSRCRKAATTCKGLDKLRLKCQKVSKGVLDRCKNGGTAFFYVDF